jgi:16S rRNA G1207 methylase RsmC
MVFGYGQFDDGTKILLEWIDVEATKRVFVRKM